MNCIEIKNVTKSYKGNKALDNVSVKFEENKIYGLLGRNGAGKSTLLNIITDRIFADSGSVTVNGMPLSDGDKPLGLMYLMSESNLYMQKTKIRDQLKMLSGIYPDFDMEYALKLANLFKLNIKKNPNSLSTGYNSIFKIIVALSVNTPYVFFDEPVLGLDANHRELFYKLLIEKYSNEPFTAIISTHLIEEVSTIIEDVIIVKNGKIIENKSREELMDHGCTISGPIAAVDSFAAGRNIIGEDVIGGLKSVYLNEVIDRKSVPSGLEISGMDLQKLFVQLTNE